MMLVISHSSPISNSSSTRPNMHRHVSQCPIQVRYRKVRYRKDPHMQNSTCKLKLTLTLTLTDTGGAVLTLMLGYRSLYITWQ